MKAEEELFAKKVGTLGFAWLSFHMVNSVNNDSTRSIKIHVDMY